MQEAPLPQDKTSLDVLIEQSTANGTWRLIQLPYSSVNLPAQPIHRLGDLIDTLTDTKITTAEDTLRELKHQKAVARKSRALAKEVTVKKEGIDETHTCTIELGWIDPDSPREYAITYTYTKGDSSLKIQATNREYFAEQANTDIVTCAITANNIPIRRRVFPYLGLFFDHGEYDTLSYKNHIRMSLVLGEPYLFNFSALPFPRILFSEDLQTHNLDVPKTLSNLFTNINSKDPQNPLACFVFIPK